MNHAPVFYFVRFVPDIELESCEHAEGCEGILARGFRMVTPDEWRGWWREKDRRRKIDIERDDEADELAAAIRARAVGKG